ncbi:MAG TPA: translation initiation factor IF-2 [Pseudolabrys sp.]|jgi:translation initiation factor IF-2
MSETKNPGEKKLSVSGKTLTLKPRTETGVVRQSFSHGRSKQVVVEKVKRRTVGGPGEAKAEPAPVVEAKKAPTSKTRATPATGASMAQAEAAPKPKPSGVVLRTLTDEERSARAHALADSRVREAEERKIAEEEARRRASRESVDRSEREAADARKREEEERRKHDEETKRKAGEVAKKRFGAEETPRTGPGARLALEADDEEAPRGRRPGAARAPTAPRPAPRGAGEKQRGRLTLVTALRADEVRERSVASFRRRTQRLKGVASNEPKEKLVREVTIPEAITIQDLANRMSERGVDVIRLLMKQGQMVTINDVIDADTAQLIAEEMGHSVRRVAEADVEEGLFDVADDPAQVEARAPVVTVMGHVDHGKTSLLDAIRSSDVAAGEAGGITQHIGAYQVTAPSGAKITFIDTPGHAAFTAMRARGAKVTDIVVLVVAADDGVMPQTVEAIHHAKAAKVPIIVAINKIDKPDAKPDRVRTDLLQHEIQVESMGGDVVDVEVSATKKTNIDKLLEMLGLQAEILDLKANPNRAAEGTVIEAKLDRGRGPVATVLIQRGTLHPGDIVVAGAEWGRVRALVSDTGEPVQSAGPSTPVEVLGFSGTPDAGDRLAVVESEARAREVTDYRARQKREKMAARVTGLRGSLEQMMAQAKTSGRKEFPLVIKADVQGSVEAIIGALDKLATDEVAARVLHSGVGGISESDVTLAEASGVPIIAFNVRANKEAREAAERAGIEIRYYNIIYDLVDDVKKAMSGLLPPTLRETMLGNAQILEIFKVSKVGNIAGCKVTDGTVERGANVRLIRDNVVIHEGKLSQLKRFKDDVREVGAGMECGMAFENYQDMRQGDVIECYRVEQIQRSL